MTEVRFLDAAEQEMVNAAAYYESRAEDLGLRFLREVQRAARLAAENPLAWPAVRAGVRRIKVRRFPFGLLYRVDPDACVILAVMALRRDPDYWLYRLEQ